jgi:hypothetical protein
VKCHASPYTLCSESTNGVAALLQAQGREGLFASDHFGLAEVVMSCCLGVSSYILHLSQLAEVFLMCLPCLNV